MAFVKKIYRLTNNGEGILVFNYPILIVTPDDGSFQTTRGYRTGSLQVQPGEFVTCEIVFDETTFVSGNLLVNGGKEPLKGEGTGGAQLNVAYIGTTSVNYEFLEPLGHKQLAKEIFEKVKNKIVAITPNLISLELGLSASISYGSNSYRRSSWIQSETNPDIYIQTHSWSGFSNTAKYDLQPDASAIEQLIADGISTLYVENVGENNTLKVIAIGGKPSADMTIQATATEVTT